MCVECYDEMTINAIILFITLSDKGRWRSWLSHLSNTQKVLSSNLGRLIRILHTSFLSPSCLIPPDSPDSVIDAIEGCHVNVLSLVFTDWAYLHGEQYPRFLPVKESFTASTVRLQCSAARRGCPSASLGKSFFKKQAKP